MIERVTTAFTGLALAVLCAVTAVGVHTQHIFAGNSGLPLFGLTFVGWAAFAVAFLLLRRMPLKVATAFVVAGTLGMGAAAMAGPPNTSTDSARYAWDGIVANAGVSPYAHVPAADALDPQREAWLWPQPGTAPDGSPRCIGDRVTGTTSVPDGDTLCSNLNRPQVPTIYPPVAQLWFAATRSVVPPTAEYWVEQAAGLVVSLVVTLLLVWSLRRTGRDPRWAAMWGWCPFVASEAVTNSHVDALGVLLVVAASVVAVPAVTALRGAGGGRRALLTGVLVGLAAATKFVPVIAALPLAKRHTVRVGLAAAVTFVVVYLPYVVVTGWQVVGYLPGYLSEQGYQNGDGFALVSLVVPGRAAVVVSAVLLVVIAVLQWRHTDPDEPWLAQLVGAGAMLLVVSSPYPWYALVLIPFVALTRRWEWLAVPFFMTAHLLVPDASPTWLSVALSVVTIVAVHLWRRRARSLDPTRAVA